IVASDEVVEVAVLLLYCLTNPARWSACEWSLQLCRGNPANPRPLRVLVSPAPSYHLMRHGEAFHPAKLARAKAHHKPATERKALYARGSALFLVLSPCRNCLRPRSVPAAGLNCFCRASSSPRCSTCTAPDSVRSQMIPSSFRNCCLKQ